MYYTVELLCFHFFVGNKFDVADNSS